MNNNYPKNSDLNHSMDLNHLNKYTSLKNDLAALIDNHAIAKPQILNLTLRSLFLRFSMSVTFYQFTIDLYSNRKTDVYSV
jgi:hypothetical protein